MTTMNTHLKSLACGMGALAITAVLSWTFVQQSAGVTHGTPTAQVAKLSIQHRHVRLGQFEPAVLVD